MCMYMEKRGYSFGDADPYNEPAPYVSKPINKPASVYNPIQSSRLSRRF